MSNCKTLSDQKSLQIKLIYQIQLCNATIKLELFRLQKHFHFLKKRSLRLEFRKKNGMDANGPALTIVRVCALFHCPPLNNFTKIKLSQQTTKTPHFCWTRVISCNYFFISFNTFWANWLFGSKCNVLFAKCSASSNSFI